MKKKITMSTNEKPFFPENIYTKKLNYFTLKTFFNVCEEWKIKSCKELTTGMKKDTVTESGKGNNLL